MDNPGTTGGTVKVYPVVDTDSVPDDPTLSELQAHARALGMNLHIVLTGFDGIEFERDRP